ncbi:hypothetical protein BO78DRAFT_396401, partial [Aspergillus sclerotiicarbonarius CBS 121057]
MSRLPLRAKLLFRSRERHAMLYFSTRPPLRLNKNFTSGNKKDPGYWQYDFSFRTQMQKIVLIGVLALIGSAGPWSWDRDIRHWWNGVPDHGD